jgi:peptidoglycan hydrolase-like protein with peptidoglycan-binding domain
MRQIGIAAAVLLGIAMPASTALAQAPPQLTYVQPLTPQALKEVQQRLKQLGAYTGGTDGIWGRDSQAALEHFQQSRGLQVTGQLNQATAATLGLTPSDLLALGPTPNPPPLPMRGDALRADAVRTIQGRLRQLGLYNGETDGVWGPGTESAVERFQQSRGLQPTGQLDPNTLTTMGLDPNTVLAQTR